MRLASPRMDRLTTTRSWGMPLLMPSSSLSGDHRLGMICFVKTRPRRPAGSALPADPVRFAILTILVVGMICAFMAVIIVAPHLPCATGQQQTEAHQ